MSKVEHIVARIEKTGKISMKKINLLLLALLTTIAACSTQSYHANDEEDTLLALIKERQQARANATPFFNQSAISVAQTGYLANPNVQAFIQYHSQKNPLDINYLNNFFASVGYRGDIINIMNRPSTSRPWYVFEKDNASASKIAAGARFYQQNRVAIDRAAAKYGVPASIIVAIIGIETNYGSYMGKMRTADALATLAFDYPRRGAFFQQELAEFLQLAQEEHRDPMSFTGSYAGAMGMPQFMPSSFRKWAVDANGDGYHDIWRNIDDVVASVANYMKQHGWQTGGKMVIPVALTPTPQLNLLMEEKTALNHTVKSLRQMGVVPLQSVDDNEKAVLFRLETASGQYQYFIGLNNFYTVWRYNNSRLYVMAVRNIANGVMGDGL